MAATFVIIWASLFVTVAIKCGTWVTWRSAGSGVAKCQAINNDFGGRNGVYSGNKPSMEDKSISCLISSEIAPQRRFESMLTSEYDRARPRSPVATAQCELWTVEIETLSGYRAHSWHLFFTCIALIISRQKRVIDLFITHKLKTATLACPGPNAQYVII